MMRTLLDPRNLRIRTQLVLGMTMSLICVGVFLVLWVPSKESEVLRETEEARLTGLAETTAHFITAALDFQNPTYAKETMELLSKLRDVHQVRVFDVDGQLFAETTIEDSSPDESRLHTIEVPVVLEGEPLGALVLIARTDVIESTASTMRMIVFWAVLAILVIGTVGAFALGGFISNPVRQLQAATSAIAAGSLDVKVPVQSKNELGELAHNFNIMVDALSRTTTSRDLLEHEVKEREKAIREVERHREKAEIASRSKSEFLANMSHEIRTPMNAIIGLVDLALEGEMPQEQRGHLETVLRSSQHLLGIINDVLDLSKIEAGKLELFLEETDLAELLSDVALQQTVVAENRELCVHAAIEEGVPRHVRADALRLRQILTNLVGNAIKFTPKGFISIRIGSVDSIGDRTWLRFQVEDTGIGIPKEKQAHIFMPFEQADGSTTRNYGGTGLGLAITTRLVQKMEGDLSVESEVGRGSTFEFRIPVEPVEKSSPEFDRIRSHAAFLAVEDARSRSALQHTLEFWGIRIADLASDADLLLEETRPTAQADAAANAGQRISVIAPKRNPRPEDGPAVAAPFAPMSVAHAVARALGVPIETKRTHRSGVQKLDISNRKVLLAEDNKTNQLVASRLLDRLGLEVMVVENGKDAVEAVLDEDFAIVFMDWHMPVMNGLEATREIRRLQTHTMVPIIGLTANALPGDRETCLEAGMDGYISKPIERRALEDLVRELTERDGRNAAASAA